jgi:hypothetical protein
MECLDFFQKLYASPGAPFSPSTFVTKLLIPRFNRAECSLNEATIAGQLNVGRSWKLFETEKSMKRRIAPRVSLSTYQDSTADE